MRPWRTIYVDRTASLSLRYVAMFHKKGWNNSVHKGRHFEGISSDTSYAQSFSLDNVQLTSGMALILMDAFWSQNEPRRVSATDGCHS